MTNVTADKRASKKANRAARLAALGRPHPEHVQRTDPKHPDGSPLPVNCPVCRPPGNIHV